MALQYQLKEGNYHLYDLSTPASKVTGEHRLRLRTATDIKSRLTFFNLGSSQVPTVLVGHVNGAQPTAYAGAGFKEMVYFINVDKVAQTLTIDALKGKAFVLHPVHAAASAADQRAATATYTAGTGAFQIPARTAVVFVVK